MILRRSSLPQPAMLEALPGLRASSLEPLTLEHLELGRRAQAPAARLELSSRSRSRWTSAIVRLAMLRLGLCWSASSAP